MIDRFAAGAKVLTWRKAVAEPHCHHAEVIGGRRETHPGSVSWTVRFPDGFEDYRYEDEMCADNPIDAARELAADQANSFLRSSAALLVRELGATGVELTDDDIAFVKDSGAKLRARIAELEAVRDAAA